MWKVWQNYFTTLEIEDNYIEKKYKNLLKTKQPNRIIRYEDFLFFKEIYPIIQLMESLCFDGRFYGADMTEDGYDTLDELRGCLSFLNDGTIDSVELIRQVRDSDIYDD